MDSTTIRDLIERGLPEATVKVISDDNTHFQAIVISDIFADKRRLARHQLVYSCLGSLVGTDIHALSIRAYTAEEWSSLQSVERETD